jgi:hypothetical protein
MQEPRCGDVMSSRGAAFSFVDLARAEELRSMAFVPPVKGGWAREKWK